MLNKRLRNLRIKNQYTQQYMAEVLGIEARTYRAYETGTIKPTLDKLVKIADILDVPTDFLLGRDDYLKKLGIHIDEPLDVPPGQGRVRKRTDDK